MNESLIKYLAGLMDADGSLSFQFSIYQHDRAKCFVGLCLSLAGSESADPRGFVDELPQMTGMGQVYRYGKDRQFKAWRVMKRSDLEMLLPRLIKHMVIKASHWQWVLDTWREHRGAAIVTAQRESLTASSKQSRIKRCGPVKPKNHPTWAWLAGYLDGDGWYRHFFETRSRYWSSHVGAVAHGNDAYVLEFLRSAFGGYIRPHGQAENVWVWKRNLGARDASFALRFLPNVAKHSRLKRHKIDQMIHHHRQRLSVPSLEGQATV